MKDGQSKKYLMKRRRYGYGWIPVTWQGWTMLLLQGVLVVAAATFLPAKPAQPTTSELIRFLIILVCAVATIVLVSVQSGPRAKWRWGKKPSDDPDEDF